MITRPKEKLPSSAFRLLVSLARPYSYNITILFFFAVAQALLSAASPRLVGIAVDVGLPAARGSNQWPLLTIALALTACAAGSATLSGLWRKLAGKIGQSVVYDLRREVFIAFQSMPIARHEQIGSSNLVAPLTSDVEAVNVLFSTSLGGLLQALLGIAVTTLAMFTLDYQLALFTVGVLAPFAFLSAWSSRQLSGAFQDNRASISELTAHIIESLNAIRVVHAYRSMHRNDEIFTRISERTRNSGRKIQLIRAVYWPIVELILSSNTLLIVTVGGLSIIAGKLEVGVLAAFILYSAQFTQPIMNMSSFLDTLHSAMAALRRISELLQQRSDAANPMQPCVALTDVKGEVTFKDVKFAYDRGSSSSINPEIDRLDFSLLPRQTVAMLGVTGAGKSTIAKLIARFYDPLEGSILLDGIDLRRITDRELRDAVVMLTQEVFLFSGSITDNIRISRPSATNAEVEAAARAVGAHSFIETLSNGYCTDVQVGGARLSAGQRQMVAFARAFLANPAVLILDEATAALDIPTERAMETALRTLAANRTTLIIAHRLSTVHIADRVLVVSHGGIIEDGTPKELMLQNSEEISALYRDGNGMPINT